MVKFCAPALLGARMPIRRPKYFGRRLRLVPYKKIVGVGFFCSVCWTKKFLYGLNQSLRTWFDMVREVHACSLWYGLDTM
jgi:hypothetical protein